MAKVTSKLQVTIPKRIAERFGIQPGNEIEFQEAGEVIRLVVDRERPTPRSIAERLRLFDAATERQREREQAAGVAPSTGDRGWTRDGLYDRGSPR